MQDHTAFIRVSDLTHYMLCPRLVYFSARGYEQPKITKGKERSFVEHILLKELGFSVHTAYGRGNERGADESTEMEEVKRVIEDTAASLEWVYKEELKNTERSLIEDVKSDFLSSIENTEWLKKLKTESTLTELERSFGFEREHIMISEKLGMSGSVDKLIKTEVEIIPCVIKTGKCPEYGVWKSDRMQLAAYALLIEEEFGTIVRRGFVDYIHTAEMREVQIRKRDRALTLQILKHVKKIHGGFFPDKGENAPCDSCYFTERCDTKMTLLSKLFGK